MSNNYNTYELILIDDCSTDNSWNIIQNICNKSKFVKGLLLRKNVCQHNAIFAGLKYSSGKYVLTMDDDGQNSTNDIISLIEEKTYQERFLKIFEQLCKFVEYF